eukprot:4417385-Pleurochrysis_carterae.AAC.7
MNGAQGETITTSDTCTNSEDSITPSSIFSFPGVLSYTRDTSSYFSRHAWNLETADWGLGLRV